MKKYYLFVVLFSISILTIFAQTPISLESDEMQQLLVGESQQPKITGQLINFEPGELDTMELSYSLVKPFSRNKQTGIISVEVQPDGHFEYTLDKTLPYQQMWIRLKRGDLEYYFGELLVYTDLQIIADLEKLREEPVSFWGEGIAFSGSEGKLTEIANIKNKYKGEELKPIRKEKHQIIMDRNLPIVEKSEKLEKVYEQFTAFDEQLWLEHPNDYVALFENERRSEYYGEQLVIHWGRKMDDVLFMKMITHEPYLISNSSSSYYKYLSDFLRMPTHHERMEIYKKVIAPHVTDQADFKSFLALREKIANKEPYDKEAAKQWNKKYLKPHKDQIATAELELQVKKLNRIKGVKSDILKVRGAPGDIWRREAYLEKVLPTMRTSWGKEMLSAEYEKDKKIRAATHEKLAAMKPLDKAATLGENVFNVEGMQFYKANQKTVEELLQNLKAKYKKKGIILDIWATWCAPCLDDMKKGKSQKAELKKLPLEIVYICSASGSDLETWKRKIVELDVPGDHIFLDEKLANELLKFFDLRGYPSYVFMDQTGKYDRELIQRIQNVDVEAVKERLKVE